MKLALQWGAEPIEISGDFSLEKILLQTPSGEVHGRVMEWAPPFFELESEGQWIKGALFVQGHYIDVHLPCGNYRLSYPQRSRSGTGGHGEGSLNAPMPGKVLKVYVTSGDEVAAGDTLMVLEAMKMEHKILSPRSGRIKRVLFAEGARIAQDELLIEME